MDTHDESMDTHDGYTHRGHLGGAATGGLVALVDLVALVVVAKGLQRPQALLDALRALVHVGLQLGVVGLEGCQVCLELQRLQLDGGGLRGGRVGGWGGRGGRVGGVGRGGWEGAGGWGAGGRGCWRGGREG